MKDAVPFQSQKSMEITIQLRHRGFDPQVWGSRKGITLIAGGGYHGKSTLLPGTRKGVYDHIAGDGREFVITDDTAWKLRAEGWQERLRMSIFRCLSIIFQMEEIPEDFLLWMPAAVPHRRQNIIEAIEGEKPGSAD